MILKSTREIVSRVCFFGDANCLDLVAPEGRQCVCSASQYQEQHLFTHDLQGFDLFSPRVRGHPQVEVLE